VLDQRFVERIGLQVAGAATLVDGAADIDKVEA
jgi:hypothetical protein